MSDQPIEIKATIVGAVEIEARFLTGRARVKEYVLRETHILTTKLQRKVKEEKLSGQVLKVRTGRLRRSINRRVDVLADQVIGRVGTNVEYGRTWELTGTPAMDIFPSRAKALRWIGPNGQPVFAGNVHKDAVGPKPFLKPALAELRPEAVIRLAAAAYRGI